MNTEPIAVVGIACRYPDATGPDELWQTVLGRRRGFRLLPEQRLGVGYRGDRDDPDVTYVTHAGLLRDWTFDRERFGIPGPLYRSADHSHWLALATAADVLADAGLHADDLDRDGVDRDRVGVVIGNSLTGEFSRSWTVRARLPFLRSAAALAMDRAGVDDDRAALALAELEHLVRSTFAEPNDETLAGSLSNTIAGRICNHFDFHGTGYTVDGACSSSLLAVMTACRALRDGELDLAIAGGVDLSLDPLELVGFARVGALAVDEMRVYDADPTGFLPGEGCGMVALMRAEQADRLGLRSYARIVGWGTSSDGSGGLTRPAAHGQVKALRRAYAMAGLDPTTVGLVEGHGTGTAVGDRVELETLREVLTGPGRATPAALGSIKANIGHTKAAAGVAGLIKAALAVHHRVLPPTTGCDSPHGLLRDGGSPVQVLAEPREWTGPDTVAAVSSMGFGGINSHVVLAGADPGRPVAPAATLARLAAPLPDHDIVLLGAADRAELDQRLAALAEQAARLSRAELHDLAVTCHTLAGDDAYRAALIAARPTQLAEAAGRARDLLADLAGPLALDERAGAVVAHGPAARVGLLFPGQAAPVRADLPDWARRLDVPAFPDGLVVRDGEVATEQAQPAVVRSSLAGVAWLDALGCRPVAATGHSLGEISALVWAGALSAADGLALAAARGRLMAEHGLPGSTMASLATDVGQTRQLIGDAAVVVAGRNGLRQTTIAGHVDEVRAVLARAAADGVAGRQLPVSHGFHSPAMDPVGEPLRAALRELTWREPVRSVVSTTTGAPLPAGTDLADLLVDQLTRPVEFLAAVTHLAAGCDLLVEVGPGTILAGLAADCGVTLPTVSLDCGGPQRRHAWVTAVLAATGAGDPAPFFAGRPARSMLPGQPVALLENQCETLPSVALPAGDRLCSARESALAPVAGTDSPAGVAAGSDPLGALRRHLSRVLELPLDGIRPDASLLGDLHLNSLQVVQTFAELAGSLGKVPGQPPAELAGATVGRAAELLADLPDAAGESDTVEGVRPDVRVFAHSWVPYRPGPARTPVSWQVHAPDGHWLPDVAAEAPANGPRIRHGLAVVLPDVAADTTAPPGDTATRIAGLMALIGAEQPDRLLVVHHDHPAAAALARSAVAEIPGCAATVVDVPPGQRLTDLGVADHRGYLELRMDPQGGILRSQTMVRPVAGAEPLPLSAGDVVLVTGGVTGITASSAAVLAEEAGAVLVVFGRSSADDPRVRAGLAQLAERVPAHYVSCDVTDPQAVPAALAAAAVHGPVAALVHGAGVNEPRRMSDVDGDGLRRTLAPKVDGLRHLLDAAGDRLKLVLAYGSIIGRCGLAGQPEYCLANDWMRIEVERWAQRHPGCRAHVLEWSVWADRGMGVRLGALDGLRRQGVTPIDPERGEAVLRDLLADPGTPVTVLVTSRFPATPALATPTVAPTGTLRFAEERHDLLPSVEVVLESSLTVGSDPYLADHRLDGTAVFPAVLGMEAMAQATATLRGTREVWSLRDAAFTAPITVPERAARTLRTAALGAAHDPDEVEVVLRDDSDGFAGTRFRATVAPAGEPPAPVGARTPVSALDRPHAFYGPVLFHEGRFQRLTSYEWLSAFAVRAWVDADPAARWFSEFHGQELLLGDPGVLDASIHVLLACVPHRRALPVAVERFTAWRPVDGPVLVSATERSHTADEYVFDVDLHDPDGRPVATWTGLHLRAVGPHRNDPLPFAAMGPSLARRLIECEVADDIDIWSLPGATATPARTVPGWSGPVATYRTGWGVIGARAPRPVAFDWRLSGPSMGETDPAPDRLALDIADKTGEPVEVAVLRVQVAEAALRRLPKRPATQPLRLDQVVEPGLVVVRSNGTQVLVARVAVAGGPAPVTVAVAIDGGQR
ncbi:type I polyketide synthase [Micromonospora echinofusca]|uniref:SDR family NAD(P)-dependent oxidoreductase n=1 Tax=Micromonospora echinofusca TaxID=47858 RepID=A0ABS3VN60_MICEH|nr:type I polyketide synthase [Micromonospora echinofusca]MBO4205932.1 SDR family NAD(P)-dependent oxidoreductase [Micromonospora echinofusca]